MRLARAVDPVDAVGQRHAVAEIGRYKLTADSCPFRFSAVGLDREAAPSARSPRGPDGPEDLYVERDRDLIWTTAEHPNERVTLGFPMQGARRHLPPSRGAAHIERADPVAPARARGLR